MSDRKMYEDLNYIKYKVDSIQKIELLNLSSNTALKQKYIDILNKDQTLRKTYLAIDGKKSQKEIAEYIGVTPASVTYKIKSLDELGLIELVDVQSNNKIHKLSIAEKAFNLRKILNV